MKKSKQAYYRAWFENLSGFVDQGVQSLPRSELAVYLILLRDTKSHNAMAQTALTDLATRGGLSKRSASRAVQSLIRRGVLQVVRHGVPGKPAAYTIFPTAVFKTLNPPAARSLEADDSGN